MARIIEADDLHQAVALIARDFKPIEGLRGILVREGLLTRLQRSRAWRGGLAAVDSAFPKSPVYLVGATLSLVAVASVLQRPGSRGVESRTRSWLLAEQGEIEQDFVSAYARLAERREALRLIRGEPTLTLLVDGEILPRRGRSPLWEEVLRLSLELADSGSCIAGVLKRSYSRTVGRRLGLDLSDRVLASATLRRGEAIIVEHSVRDLRARGCLEALYKPLRGIPAAVRVEFCGCEPLPFLSWLASSAGPSGLPWPIDLVDSLAKKEAARIAAVETLLLSKLARRELQHLGYTANPQESMRKRREEG